MIVVASGIAQKQPLHIRVISSSQLSVLAEARQYAIFSKPDSKSDLHKSFACPACNKRDARQGAVANHAVARHLELHGAELAFYTVVYNPESDEVLVDSDHKITRMVEPRLTPQHKPTSKPPQASNIQPSPKARKRRHMCPSPRRSMRTSGPSHGPQQQQPQQQQHADTAKISDLHAQLADARVAVAEAKAEGLQQLLAERGRQQERHDQAQRVKDEQINELIQVTKQQTETTNTMSKALAIDERAIRVKSVEGAQKASNEFHAFKNASQAHGA